MKDKPFDIINVSILDKTNEELVFDRPMYIAITGKARQELTCIEAQKSYRRRFDVEVNYRFCKQNLLMDKLQSPEISHQDTWLNLVKLCCWLLYVSTKELLEIDIPVWQRSLPINKNKIRMLFLNEMSPCLRHKEVSIDLFCTFAQTPFLPQSAKR